MTHKRIVFILFAGISFFNNSLFSAAHSSLSMPAGIAGAGLPPLHLSSSRTLSPDSGALPLDLPIGYSAQQAAKSALAKAQAFFSCNAESPNVLTKATQARAVVAETAPSSEPFSHFNDEEMPLLSFKELTSSLTSGAATVYSQGAALVGGIFNGPGKAVKAIVHAGSEVSAAGPHLTNFATSVNNVSNTIEKSSERFNTLGEKLLNMLAIAGEKVYHPATLFIGLGGLTSCVGLKIFYNGTNHAYRGKNARKNGHKLMAIGGTTILAGGAAIGVALHFKK